MSKFRQIDVAKLKTTSIEDRFSKVASAKLAKVYQPGMGVRQFLETLPEILKGADFRELVGHIGAGQRKGKPLLWMMGAHVIKCGLAPIVIDLIQHKIISAVAVNAQQALIGGQANANLYGDVASSVGTALGKIF